MVNEDSECLGHIQYAYRAQNADFLGAFLYIAFKFGTIADVQAEQAVWSTVSHKATHWI